MASLPEPRSRTVDAIYASYAASRSAWRSAGIAVSELGTECDRAIWYRFRWADSNEPIDGRKARLFDTGNREETRLVAELRAIGVEVWEVDPDTGRQWTLRSAGEHVRGKADGVLVGLPDAPATPHLLEAKSHSAKNFRELTKVGVREAFPKHYAQCQIGMHLLGLNRALYLATCKDDDNLHAERLEYDVEFCLRAMARAERIINADGPPVRLHPDPGAKTAWACKFCPAFGACHEGGWPESNCRTCLYVSPVAAGKWHCARFDRILTLDEQKAGCPAHLYVPALVPGTQIDASEADETVTYRLHDGSPWVDGRIAA